MLISTISINFNRMPSSASQLQSSVVPSRLAQRAVPFAFSHSLFHMRASS
jgi:hypothetical protein